METADAGSGPILFHGRVEGGKAVFGLLVLDHGKGGAGDGRAARLFVRPHDRFRTLAISVGDRVYGVPRDAKVFVEDYSI